MIRFSNEKIDENEWEGKGFPNYVVVKEDADSIFLEVDEVLEDEGSIMVNLNGEKS